MTSVDPDVVAHIESGAAPAPPETLDRGQEHVVAIWRSGDLAAVLSIAQETDDGPEQYVQLLHRSDGEWHSDTSCGSDWPVGYGDRPSWAQQATFTGLRCSSAAGVAWSGIALRGVYRVRAEFPDGTSVESRVEPVTGAFIVGGTGIQEPTITTVG